MISLFSVSKRYITSSAEIVILDDVSVEFPTDGRVALLGGLSCGKSTFIKMLAGLENPSSGDISRHVEVSPPVGNGRIFRQTMSAEQNTYFLARCYGVDPGELWEFVSEFAKLGPEGHHELRLVAPEIRLQFAYTLALGIPFDVYLFDGRLVAGGADFRERYLAALNERLDNSGLVLATRDLRLARQACTSALVMLGGNLKYFPELEEGIMQMEAAKLE